MLTRMEIEQELASLRATIRLIATALVIMAVLWIASTAMLLGGKTVLASEPVQGKTLRLRNLVVVDENGKDRVWIGAPLPNPPLFGRRYKRKNAVSGILIFDREGNERGGYVTEDVPSGRGSAFLTVDSLGAEQGVLAAEDAGGASLSLSNDAIRVSIEAHDKPTLRMAEGNKVIVEIPTPEDQKEEDNK